MTCQMVRSRADLHLYGFTEMLRIRCPTKMGRPRLDISVVWTFPLLRCSVLRQQISFHLVQHDDFMTLLICSRVLLSRWHSMNTILQHIPTRPWLQNSLIAEIANPSRDRAHRTRNYGDRIDPPVGGVSHIGQGCGSTVWDVLEEDLMILHVS
jgi:hypothetical protein